LRKIISRYPSRWKIRLKLAPGFDPPQTSILAASSARDFCALSDNAKRDGTSSSVGLAVAATCAALASPAAGSAPSISLAAFGPSALPGPPVAEPASLAVRTPPVTTTAATSDAAFPPSPPVPLLPIPPSSLPIPPRSPPSPSPPLVSPPPPCGIQPGMVCPSARHVVDNIASADSTDISP